MPKFEWSQSFSVGSDELDNDHRVLLGYINELDAISQKFQNGESPCSANMSAVLGKLWTYTDQHFDREEAYMRAHNYPHIASHKSSHDDLRSSLKDMVAKVESKGFSALAGVLVFLSSWWLSHITRTDREYAQYIQGSPSLKEVVQRPANSPIQPEV